MGAGAEDDPRARLPDCPAKVPAQIAISAKAATTIKLEEKICKTRRLSVMVDNSGLKVGIIVAPRSGIYSQVCYTGGASLNSKSSGLH